MDNDVRLGRTLGKEFWVRFRVGINVAMAWVSPDGRNWWLQQPQPFQGRQGGFQIGLEVLSGKVKKPRHISVDEISFRRLDSILRMVDVDEGLLAKAKLAVTDDVRNAATRDAALAVMDKAREKDVDPARWVAACDLNLMTGSPKAAVYCEAIRELFRAPIRRAEDADVENILAAARELTDVMYFSSTSSDLSVLLKNIFGSLGQHCLETGKTEALRIVMDASYLRPGSAGLPAAGSLSPVSPGLLRMYLLNLMTRGKWKSLRLEAAKAMFMSHQKDQKPLPLANWALTEARGHLVDKSTADPPAIALTRRHPLVVNDDREMLNALGEFIFLVQDEHYESACKTITSRTLPDALVSLGREEDVLQSSHFRVREVIRSIPQLRKILREQHTEIGMIRLERARKQNDLGTLRSLAVQFYGTIPGFGAMHVLADRDLSNGNFYGAAGRYRLLQDEQDYPRRSDAAAKFRLASAMLGQLVGKPVDKTVVLPGGRFSPQEFEQMIKRLAKDRKSAHVARAAGSTIIAPGPKGTAAHLTRLGDVPGQHIVFQNKRARPTAFAVHGNLLVVSHADKLFAVDPGSKRILWSFEPESKHRHRSRRRPQRSGLENPARLLQIGERLYVRSGLQGRPLTCVETKTGKRLWSKPYDDCVLSDPILIGSWVSVISARYGTSDALHLHRVSPETGESSLSSKLVSVRDKWPIIGRPVVIADAIIFRTAGCLVNCDLRGAVRWARRLPFVPATVLPELHTGMALDDMIVQRDGSVIFSAPGCPYIMCVSAESGKLLWSFMVQSPTRLIGPAAGSIIVAESERICALDPATGKLWWQHHCSTDDVGILPAESDSLLLVRLNKPSSGPKKPLTSPGVRYLRWISARDGRTVKDLQVQGDATIYGVWKLFSDGKRVFGLSNIEPNKSSQGKVFMVEIRG